MDPIERRLKALEEESVSIGERISNQVFGKYPLLVCACGMVCGVVLGGVTSVDSMLWFAVLVCAIVSMCGVWRFLSAGKNMLVAAVCAFVVFMCVGGVRIDSFHRPVGDDIRLYVGEERLPATIRGTIVSRVRLEDRDKWVFGRYLWGEKSSSFYLKLDEAKFRHGWGEVCGTVRVQVSGEVDRFGPGDKVAVYCWLDWFDGPGNPGQFDVQKYLWQRGVYIAASVKSERGVKPLYPADDETKLHRLAVKSRERIKLIAENSLLGDGYWEENDQGLAGALLLGNRSGIDSETYQAFVKTGLAHFISLSGLHMGMLAGMVWWMLRFVGFSKRWRAVITIVIIVGYVLVLPPRAPTIRAAIMCVVFCLGVLIRRKTNSLNALSLAAIVLLLIKPTDAFNAGWQLSFATVLGIILLQEPIWVWMMEVGYYKHAGKVDKLLKSRWWYTVGSVVKSAGMMVSVGLAAWIGGAGVLLYHFGVLTATACLWTAIVFPVVAVLLGVGYLQIISSVLVPSVSIGAGIVVQKVSLLLSEMVKLISHIDRTQVSIGRVTVTIAVMYYVGLLMLKFCKCRNYYLQKSLLTVGVCLMVVPAVGFRISKNFAKCLEVTCLDVGHGQSIVVSTPKGENLLIDAGSLTSDNCGQRVVVPYLREKGIGRLDGVFISHDDMDHLNGVPEIISAVSVDGVYVNEGFVHKTKINSTAKFLKGWLGDRGKGFELTEIGLEKINGAKISQVWPSKEVCERESVSDNDKSQVLLVEYAGRKVLICGDIELLGQNGVINNNLGITADVVVMPHHGTKLNLMDDFYDRLNPEVLICSCGKGRYNSAYRSENIKSYYTPIDGAVTVRISDKGELSVEGFK